jgi:hypothetical protein
MKYIDANVFIYAYFKPKKEYGELSPKVRWMKTESKKIIEKLNNEEEKFCISLIQLSEVVNKLKIAMTWEDLRKLLLGLTSINSLEIIEVSKLLYINSVDKITQYNMDSNDISAYLIMKDKGITEIYTFDSHYQNLKDITCLPTFPNEFV